MRKALMLVLSVALALSLVAVLAGCGGGSADKDTAKQYMKDGDTAWQAASDEWDNINNLQAQITSKVMSGDMSFMQGNAGQALLAQFQTGFDNITKNDDEARQQYTAIAGLNDAQDYKDYASQMLQVLDLDAQRVMASEALLQSMSSYLQSLQPGQQPNLQQLATNPDYQRITDLQTQIDSILKSAEQLQSDKKL
jgi:uncharacterized lipoprotein YehR (DUF1307 family)